jgi:hypothetical protein
MIDQWTETLECPTCGNGGSAALTQDMSDDNSVPIVRSVTGFSVVDSRGREPIFYCRSCDVRANP